MSGIKVQKMSVVQYVFYNIQLKSNLKGFLTSFQGGL